MMLRLLLLLLLLLQRLYLRLFRARQ